MSCSYITSRSKMDIYNTPKIAWQHMLQFIDKNTKLWLPFYNDGTALKLLNDMGFSKVIHEKKDFFDSFEDDAVVIDNPPYSIKRSIIERLYKKQISFALLLPLETLGNSYMSKYMDTLQLIIPWSRYSFNPDQKKQGPFKACWFCWNMACLLYTSDAADE